MILTDNALLARIDAARGARFYEIEAGQGGLMHQALAGVEDARGRLAWIEFCNVDHYPDGTPPGYTLRVAAGGRMLAECAISNACHSHYQLHHLGWHGDHAIVVCFVEEQQVVSLPASGGAATRRSVGWPLVVAGPRIVCGGEVPDVLETIALPDLSPRLPIPIDVAPGAECSRLAFDAGSVVVEYTTGARANVTPPPVELALRTPAFAVEVERALFPRGAPPGAAVTLACALAPFWSTSTAPLESDAHAWSWPRWLPVYWYEHLRDRGASADAAAMLAMLDALTDGARPQRGWSGSLLELAAAHARRQAGVLAGVCRAGRLPAGAYGDSVEHAWTPPSNAPPALVAAWSAVVEARPVALSRRAR